MNPFSATVEKLRGQGIARAFRHRDFAIYSAGNWVSTIGMWVQRVGIQLLTWELTHSELWLGIIAFSQVVPGVLLLPLTGAIADRMDRMKLIRVTQILSSVMATVLAVTVFLDWMTIHLLLAITLVAGLVSSFAVPARMTLSPSLVPKQDITTAIAVGSALFNSSTVIGPALAGLLIVKWGFGFAFVFNAISFVAQYVTLRMITLLRQEHHAGKSQSVFTDIAEGVRYIGGHAGILPVLLSPSSPPS